MSFEDWTSVSPVGDLLVRSAALHPSRKALVMPGLVLTYADLREAAVEIARGLAGLGVAPRSHVGILANNGIELVASLFGILLADCVAVPLHARHRAHELGYIIENADLAAILTTARDTRYVDFCANITAALPSLARQDGAAPLALAEAPRLKRIVVLDGNAPAGFLGREAFAAAGAEIDIATIDGLRQRTRVRDPALLIYTSGTTANPKGCILSHEAVSRGPVERADRRFRTRDPDVTWGGGPLFHIGSLAPFLGTIGTAGTHVTDVVFEPGAALDLIEREGVTCAWPWFPAILQPMLDHPSFHPERLTTVRKMLLIAPPALVDRMQAMLPRAEIIQACGMTETAGIFALCGAEAAPEERAVSQGHAVPGVAVRTIEPDTGEDCQPGKVGEILVRGYCVMEGYYRSPEKTAEALDADGWLHTGDLYAMSESGQLTFNGRVKDMLKVGGENLAAIELEAFLCGHPAVKFAEVVGKPDPRMVEVPVAFIELRVGHAASSQELIEFCRGRLASFKVPREIFFVSEGDWPMSATKVDKRALRAKLATSD